MNRLRVGHTFKTHNQSVAKNDTPICESYGVAVTVKHMITECRKYKRLIPQELRKALQPDHQSNVNIIKFLREMKLYNSI